jgi:hypothetical protein
MAAAGNYEITSQATDQYDFSSPGTPVLGVQVYFKTGDGNAGSVFVPQARYGVTMVRELVEAAAKELDGVGRLAGGYS